MDLVGVRLAIAAPITFLVCTHARPTTVAHAVVEPHWLFCRHKHQGHHRRRRETSKHRTDWLSGVLCRYFDAPVIIGYTDNVVLVQKLSNLNFEKDQRFRAKGADAVDRPNWNMDVLSRGHLVHRIVQLHFGESLHDGPML